MARSLLHGIEHGQGDAADTLDIRIAAVFVILVASLLGSVPPLLSASFSQDHWGFRFQRAFGGGVILALALVHIGTESIVELQEIISYPVGGVTIVGGVLLMMIIEGLVLACTGHTHAHLHLDVVNSEGHHHARPAVDQIDASAARHDAAFTQNGGFVAAHKHALEQPKTSQSTMAVRVIAYMMELGCVFHSFIIGMDLGISEDNRTAAVGLLVALTFHQLLEGISLGTVVKAANFPLPKSLLMVAIYSLTTPVGIACGIGLVHAYDSGSRTATIVSGSLNGVSAGILLHIALVQLLAPLFRDRCEGSSQRVTLVDHITTTAGLLLGAGLMCMLAVWA